MHVSPGAHWPLWIWDPAWLLSQVVSLAMGISHALSFSPASSPFTLILVTVKACNNVLDAIRNLVLILVASMMPRFY